MKRDLAALVAGARRRGGAAVAALRGRGPVAGRPTDRWWDLLPFTTHRIELAAGLHTCDSGVEAPGDIRTKLVVEACGGSLADRSVVDLGCHEGGFTLAFAGLGARHALGIEAREISVRRADLARRLLELDAAEFVAADIKTELANHDPFDVVFASGILYHVADPAALLATMRAACTHVAVIDTHVAGPDEASHGCSPIVERTFGGHTYRGRIFPEYPPSVSEEAKEELIWAAYSDSDAFWPLEADLVRMINDAGFDRVEKIDPFAGGRTGTWGVDHVNRVLYLATV